MDPATVIALCKENIQPLRHGRNVAQLGTALRAQEDTEVQQLLLQEKQMHEDTIKNYVGDDPLENWYEYILWMEQSYPKSGHESHIGRLLQQCLATFEKETKYHQDRRFIRLWINYISMQKNPIELYQLLHNNGIGTMVGDMYRAWAFELEQIEDYKRADEVYLMGLATRAEPVDELDCAHKNFQLAVARKMLGRSDDGNEISFTEQRQAFSSLKAIKAGKKVGSVRTGQRVRDHLPGAVPQIGTTVQDEKGNSRIQVYQDDGPTTEGKSSSILDHVPVEEAIHKENTIKPGPWNSSSKKCPLMSSAIKTSFKVHEDQLDDNYNLDKLRLFPNHTPFFDGSKYHEYPKVPVYVSDPPNPNVILKPHYPKELVYVNNVDQSMEEIRAQQYLDRRSQGFQVNAHLSINTEVENNSTIYAERREQPFEQYHHIAQRHLEQQELHRQLYGVEKQKIETHRQKATQLEMERCRNEQLELQRQQTEELERLRYEAEQLEFKRLEAERLEAESLELQRFEAEQQEYKRLEAERIEVERIEAERIEAQRMEAELRRQQKMQSSTYMSQHQSSSTATEEHLLGQSLTVNTKEAMSAVQELWQSPEGEGSSPMINRPMEHRMADARTKLAFNIHMDSSMTQHVMSTSKHHQGFSVPIQTYDDQENNQIYPVSFSNQDHQTFGGHAVHNPYHYQVQASGRVTEFPPEWKRLNGNPGADNHGWVYCLDQLHSPPPSDIKKA